MLSMGGHDDDTDDDVDKSLLTVLKYVSSSLSVIGAGSILVSRFLDKEAWQKPARQLLLWLSVADLFTAIIYMVPAQDGPYCTVQSLVGMYFPIASFLLTDCIAYFVYLIVCDQYHGYKRWRLLRNPEQLFHLFHYISWGLPLLFCGVVFFFGHAGRSNGGYYIDWCWIKGTSDTDEFIWQFVGGKAVEWFSALLWCPPLYICCYLHLSRQEEYSRATSRYSNSTADDTTQGTESPMSLSETTINGSALSVNGSNGSALYAPLNPGSHMEGPRDHDRDHEHGNGRTNQPLLSPPLLSSSPVRSHHDSHANGHSHANGQQAHTSHHHPVGIYVNDGHHTPSQASRAHADQAARDRMLTTSTTSTVASQDHHPVTFTQFKYKLILVPVIFAFLRIWGSLRAVLAYANQTPGGHIPNEFMNFLEIMQTVCDPAQGIFNGILFAACTSKRRRSTSEGEEVASPAANGHGRGRGVGGQGFDQPKRYDYDHGQYRRGAPEEPSPWRLGGEEDGKPPLDFYNEGGSGIGGGGSAVGKGSEDPGNGSLPDRRVSSLHGQVSLKPVAEATTVAGTERDSRSASGVRWSDQHDEPPYIPGGKTTKL
mmetsp:Transcript_71934/g.203890  ORF Transcript_71934/g.203890 Transcript_71934/m.203890 type:complete len:596 (-) Transcript_71934:108-1895(-)